MVRVARPAHLALACGLVIACSLREPQSHDDAIASPAPGLVGPLSDTLAPVAADVALVVRAREVVGVGDDLGLELRVYNHSGAAITLVRPVYGSWEHARQPDYRLEWTDEYGEPILDPLGFAPDLECGVMDAIAADDRIPAAPGGEALLASAAAARSSRHVVLPSARPGKYGLRVRYLGLDIPGATALHLLSAPVPVTIRDGDPAKWACRANQLLVAADHQYAGVSVTGLVPADNGGFWLLFSRYVHEVRGGVADPRGELRMRRLGPDLEPRGDAFVVFASADEVGWVSAAPEPEGIIVGFTPGPVGGRSVQLLTIDTTRATPVASAPRIIQQPPGNPYVTSVARLDDRVAVLHHGADAALMLTVLDRTGAELGTPVRLAPMATRFDLQAVGDAWIATWLQRDGIDGGMLRRFDRDGRPIDAEVRFPLDPVHDFAGLRHRPDGFDVAYADRSTRGADPQDMMGMYLQSFDAAGRPGGRALALGRESRTDAPVGAVAWLGDAAVHAGLTGRRLALGRGPGPTITVSTSAEERILFAPVGDRLALVWEDTRDDDSPACLQLRSCTAEVYAAFVGNDGTLDGAPVRLTHDAVAKPLLPSSHDWQRYCP